MFSFTRATDSRRRRILFTMASPIPTFKELEGFGQEEVPAASPFSRLVRVVATAALFSLLVALKLAADALPSVAQHLLTSVITTSSPAAEAHSPDRPSNFAG